MRRCLLYIVPVLLVFLLLGAIACGGDDDHSDDSDPNICPSFVIANGQGTFVDVQCTDAPEPTDSPTPTPTVTPFASPTSLGSNPKAWYDKAAKYTHQVRSASDNAAQAFPDFATNPSSLTEYTAQYADVVGRITGGVDQLRPPPTGAESVYQAYDAALHSLGNALQISPDPNIIAAAQASYVDACTALQQYSDSNNIGVNLECTGPIQPGNAADFFAAITAALSTLHTKADSAESTFDALSAAQQADSTNLDAYAAGTANAYGNAGIALADPSPPEGLTAKQKAIVDAANAVFDAGQQIEFDLKGANRTPNAATAKSTLAPLQATVERACAELQSAATTAGLTTDLGCRS